MAPRAAAKVKAVWEAGKVECSFSGLWVGAGTWGSLETAHECISLS